MKTLFHISTASAGSDYDLLLLELGEQHCCYGFYNQRHNSLDHLRYFNFDFTELDSALEEILLQLPAKATRLQVLSAFPEAVLVPPKYQHICSALLQVVYQKPSREYWQDRLAEWQVINAYALPQSVYHRLHRQFGKVDFLHRYTPMIQSQPRLAEDEISLHFGSNLFSVVVRCGPQLLLAQTYFYQSPLDVVYYLLKICYEFNIEQTEVVLLLSGLLEKDSALFEELSQYFLHLEFENKPHVNLPPSPHPHHYFSSLYNLARCVS